MDTGGFGGRRAGEGFVILETNYKLYAYTGESDTVFGRSSLAELALTQLDGYR